MINKEVILAYLASQKAILFQDFKLTKLGLFGSFAHNKQSDESDIDLIVEFEPNTEDLYEKKIALKKIISDKFGRNVDLCREKYIKTYFRESILKSTIYV